MKLLIVDDEIITINGIKKGIQWDKLEFDEVLSATSADAARKIIQEKKIDIMLCDIEMPGESGTGLLEWLRDNYYDIECIFLTCHEEFQYVHKALKLESMDYLLKPIPYDELQVILKNAITRAQTKAVNDQYIKYGRQKVGEYITNAAELPKNSKKIVERVKKYIHDHLSEDLTAELLAEQAYVSTAYLFQIFKREENMTLVEYITDQRMFYASQILKDPNVSVGRAAILVGYNNYAYFTKVFKKKYGVTPSQYKRKDWIGHNS